MEESCKFAAPGCPFSQPKESQRVEVLSDVGLSIPGGQVGEIVALSNGIARGYWQRPELTASKFRIVESLGQEPAYFTGDLARQRPDGSLQYMERKDHMVKVRGCQVFTNDVEAMLRDVDGIKNVCITRTSRGQPAAGGLPVLSDPMT